MKKEEKNIFTHFFASFTRDILKGLPAAPASCDFQKLARKEISEKQHNQEQEQEQEQGERGEGGDWERGEGGGVGGG